jgi:uncharacterized protein (DUF952 family)
LIIYKIVPAALWRESEAAGRFRGSPVDLQDGFIHFSTARQVRDTAAKHFAGVSDLLLVAIDEEIAGGRKPLGLPAALRWEPSRGGDLFPHLYTDLPLAAVRWVKPLPLSPAGLHQFPDLEE